MVPTDPRTFPRVSYCQLNTADQSKHGTVGEGLPKPWKTGTRYVFLSMGGGWATLLMLSVSVLGPINSKLIGRVESGVQYD